VVPRRWFWLYRPTVPSVRAQSIQVVHMAHAMALRGVEVTLAAHPAPGCTSSADVLAFYGLQAVESFKLHLLPASRTAASLAFRAIFLQWVAKTRGRGLVYARSKRYSREALRWVGKRFFLVMEAHEVDSLQAEERGDDPEPWFKLETAVFSRADAVVANAPGTLDLLRERHPLPSAIALHNGTAASRVRRPTSVGEGVGYVGSNRKSKDLLTLARAAASLSIPVHIVGGPPTEELEQLSANKLIFDGEIRYVGVPDRLAQFRVVVLPLSDDLFGKYLTSPLKLWDYLASGVPIVGADTPALARAAPGAFLPYRPGDEHGLAEAIQRVASDESLRKTLLDKGFVRTWSTRAEELERFLSEVL
jgi:glycosyltransferase involved in cell wall biosynthesis